VIGPPAWVSHGARERYGRDGIAAVAPGTSLKISSSIDKVEGDSVEAVENFSRQLKPMSTEDIEQWAQQLSKAIFRIVSFFPDDVRDYIVPETIEEAARIPLEELDTCILRLNGLLRDEGDFELPENSYHDLLRSFLRSLNVEDINSVLKILGLESRIFLLDTNLSEGNLLLENLRSIASDQLGIQFPETAGISKLIFHIVFNLTCKSLLAIAEKWCRPEPIEEWLSSCVVSLRCALGHCVLLQKLSTYDVVTVLGNVGGLDIFIGPIQSRGLTGNVMAKFQNTSQVHELFQGLTARAIEAEKNEFLDVFKRFAQSGVPIRYLQRNGI
jgi:hypothetical protein